MRFNEVHLNETDRKIARPPDTRPIFVVWHQCTGSRPVQGLGLNYVISPTGIIYHLLDEACFAGTHASDSQWGVFRGPECNVYSIGIGLESPGKNKPVGHRQWRAAVDLARYLSATWDISLDRIHYVGHSEIAQVPRDDPSSYSVERLVREALDEPPRYEITGARDSYLAVQGSLARQEPSRSGAVLYHLVAGELYDTDGYTDEGQQIASSSRWYRLSGENEFAWVHSSGFGVPGMALYTPPPYRITLNTPLLGDPGDIRQSCLRYILARNRRSGVTEDVSAIVWTYFDLCQAVGLNALLAVAQCILETDHLGAQWMRLRNPCGLGREDASGRAVAFPTWSDGVRAHVGRLLAYALPRKQGTARQQDLIQEALTWRPVADQYRGCAPTLRGLSGTWKDDPEYARRIRDLANHIKTSRLGDEFRGMEQSVPDRETVSKGSAALTDA